MATRSLGALTLDVIAKIGGFERGMDAAERKSARTADNIARDQKKRAKEVETAWKNVGPAIAAGLAVVATATVAVVKAQIDFADTASKAAQSAGVTTEAFTAYSYAAELSGVETATLGRAFTELNKKINENSDALTNLGIQTRDAQGRLKSADAVLLEVADRFSRMQDGAEKSALAVELFGQRVGPQLIPFLNQGRAGLDGLTKEAERLGVVISTDFGRAAEEFNDNITRLQQSLKGLAITIAGPVVIGINGLIEKFKEGAREGESFLVTLLKQTEIARLLGLNQTRNQYTEVRKELDLVNKALDGQLLSEQQRLNFTRRKADLERQIAGFLSGGGRRGLDDPRVIPGAYGQLPAAVTSGARAGRTGGGSRAATQTANEADRYLETLRRQVEAMDELSVRETVLRDIQLGRLGVVTGQQQAAILEIADQIDAYRELEKITRQFADLERESLAQRKALADEGNSIRLSVRTEAEKYGDELERLNFLLEKEAINMETYTRAASALRDEYQKTQNQVQEQGKETNSLAEELGMTFSSAFEDAIVAGKSLQDVLKGLAQDILRIVTRKLVTEPLGNVLSGAISSIFGGFRALGGPVMPNTLYRVNENGPEMLEMGGRQYLMTGNQAGNIVPNQGGGGGPVIQVNVTAVPGMTRATALQQGYTIAQGANRALARNG